MLLRSHIAKYSIVFPSKILPPLRQFSIWEHCFLIIGECKRLDLNVAHTCMYVRVHFNCYSSRGGLLSNNWLIEWRGLQLFLFQNGYNSSVVLIICFSQVLELFSEARHPYTSWPENNTFDRRLVSYFNFLWMGERVLLWLNYPQCMAVPVFCLVLIAACRYLSVYGGSGYSEWWCEAYLLQLYLLP